MDSPSKPGCRKNLVETLSGNPSLWTSRASLRRRGRSDSPAAKGIPGRLSMPGGAKDGGTIFSPRFSPKRRKLTPPGPKARRFLREASASSGWERSRIVGRKTAWKEVLITKR